VHKLLIGINLPDLAYPLPDEFWSAVRRMRPDQFTVISGAPSETLERVAVDFPGTSVHVRPRFSPELGAWPRYALDYRPAPGEANLGECLEMLRRHRSVEQVLWVGGVQLTLSRPSRVETAGLDEVWSTQRASVQSYAQWWRASVAQARLQFPGLPCAVAPLGQGAPDLEWRWFHELKSLGCYELATYLVDHNRFMDRPFADLNWGGRGLALRELLPELGPVHNLETHDGGRLAGLSASRRASVFARYLRWCEGSGGYACVSLFSASTCDWQRSASILNVLARLARAEQQCLAA
jgi:hypothetical protein